MHVSDAVLAFPSDQNLHTFGFVAFGQLYIWRDNIIQANCGITVGANKMYMIIMVVVLGAVFTQSIQYSIVCGRDRMNNTFFNKGLQGAVNRYAVKLFTCSFFNFSMI